MSVTETVPEIDVWEWSTQKSPSLDSLLEVKKAILAHPPLRRELEGHLGEMGDETESRRVAGLTRWMLAQYGRAYELLKDCSTGEKSLRFALAECCLRGRITTTDREVRMRRPEMAAELIKKHPDLDSDERVFALLLEAQLFDNDMKAVSDSLEKHAKDLGDSPSRAFAEGRLAEFDGDYRGAKAAYLRALDRDPGHRATLLRLAYQLDLGGDDEEALDYYKRLHGLRPLDLHATINYGVLLEDHERYEEAIRCYESVLAAHPTNARAASYLKDARASLDMAFDEDIERRHDKHRQILRIPISDFELSVRARNCLAKMGVETLGDLVIKSEAELLAYKNFGETSLSEIKILLESKSLRLGMNLDTDPLPSAAPAAEVPKANRQPVEIPPGVDPAILDRVLADLDLSVRVRKALAQVQAVTIGDLIQHQESELLGMKNFGATSLNELKSRLAEFGLSLRAG